jgi:hypothetical protein
MGVQEGQDFSQSILVFVSWLVVTVSEQMAALVVS